MSIGTKGTVSMVIAAGPAFDEAIRERRTIVSGKSGLMCLRDLIRPGIEITW